MTRELVATGIFSGDPFQIIDVGAFGGIQKQWHVLGDAANHIAFEPNPDECRKLQEGNRDSNIRYYPYALGEQSGERVFYVRDYSHGCSFFDVGTPAFLRHMKRYFPHDFVDDLGRGTPITLNVTSYDDFMDAEGLSPATFLKLDVEGAELEIIRGAKKHLTPATIGLHVEVTLDAEHTFGGSLSEIDHAIQERGWFIFDIDLFRYARNALPMPYTHDFQDDTGKRTPGPTVSGKPYLADVLYLRDVLYDIKERDIPHDWQSILKACVIYEIFRLPDYSAELLVAFRDRLSPHVDVDQLLDLLTPAIRGERLDYQSHMRSFNDSPERFRPRTGRFNPKDLSLK